MSCRSWFCSNAHGPDLLSRHQQLACSATQSAADLPWIGCCQFHALHNVTNSFQHSIQQLLPFEAAAELRHQLPCCKVRSAHELVDWCCLG